MRKPLIALSCVAVLLVACAPTVGERVSVTQVQEKPTYYPHGAGMQWAYLAEGETEDQPPMFERVDGPSIVNGQEFIVWSVSGRGVETQTYREYNDRGVFIHREAGPGYVTTIVPAIQEWPAPGTLRVGQSWGGEGEATVNFVEAGAQDQFTVSYRYTVVDKRRITTLAGTFDVFVVSFESSSQGGSSANNGEVLRQELWFTPNVGNVRTKNNLYLVSSNILNQEDAGSSASAAASE